MTSYLTPPCFTTKDERLHYSPFAMEIGVVDASGKCVSVAPLEPGVSNDVHSAMCDMSERLTSSVPAGIAADVFKDKVEIACSTLSALNERNICDPLEWERFVAVHGWDDWPPAMQSKREGKLEAAAGLEIGRVPVIATFCWEHAMRRSMGERDSLLIDDKQFFEVGLQVLCPNMHLRQWADLAPSSSRNRDVGVGRM